MKKQFLGIILIACFILVLFTGCSMESPGSAASAGVSPSNTTEQAPSTPEASASQTVQETAQPSESDGNAFTGELKIEGVSFDQASNNYFGGDAAAALEQMAPLLLSAARAQGGKPLLPDENPDTSVEWAMVYQYINSYGDENTKLEKLKDGSLIVPEEEINTYFNSFFSFFSGPAPSLNTGFNIKYDENSKSYIVGRSDFGPTEFVVTGFSLSKANAADPAISATVALTSTLFGETGCTVLVEIVPKEGTMFGYSVQSVVME